MRRRSPRRTARLTTALSLLLLVLPLVVLVLTPDAARAADDAEVDAREQIEFGVRMAKRGLWSEALFRFRQAERLDPGNPRILNNMAVAHEALGQFERALEYYRAAITKDPGNKDLKQNYARFVEFYRAFRPDDQKDASVEGEPVTVARADGPDGS